MKFFDLHCDTAYKCYTQNLSFNNDALAVNTVKAACFDNWYQCFAIFIDDIISEPFEFYQNTLKYFKNQIIKKPHNLTPVFTVEGGRLIQDDLSRVEQLYIDGIKALTLTWNGENQIAGGVDTGTRLKPFGKQVIAELNRFGIFADLSHLNKQSFFDAIEVADKPIVTHTCCEYVYEHKRNIDDTQLKLLTEKNGIMGLCFYPAFLGQCDVFENIYKNIYHILELGYEDYLSIGSDFDGADMADNLSDISFVPTLYNYLKKRGINEQTLNKIFFTNAFNFFKGEV
ncbi:MAG: membrane dipeptidase [Clostridia bacterium]|nr:membrane dipeptidase [Clostridia bacterium]